MPNWKSFLCQIGDLGAAFMAARPCFYLPRTLQKPRGGDALRLRPGAFLFKSFRSA